MSKLNEEKCLQELINKEATRTLDRQLNTEIERRDDEIA